MSSFSGGGFFGHSRSSGRGIGGFLGGSHSSGHRGHYRPGGHYRQVRHRSRGCLGCLGTVILGLAAAGGGLYGLVSLLT